MAGSDNRRRFPLAFEVVDASWVTRSMRRVVLGAASPQRGTSEDRARPEGTGAASPQRVPQPPPAAGRDPHREDRARPGTGAAADERHDADDAFDELLARDNGFTDRYVKLQFLRPEVTYPEPLDMEAVRSDYPVESWPVVRTYTIRWIDRDARRIAIDFVVHGDEGVAGPWAANARPGDRLHLLGPGGKYVPDATADWHLVAGDDAALPAVLAALEAMPEGRQVHAFLEVDGPEDEQPVATTADLRLTWLHRNGAAPGSTTLIADAVRAMAWPAGRAQAFVHGEAGLLKALRSYLKDERMIDRDDLSISGYWRHGNNEEGFREWKSVQVGAGAA